MTLLGKFKRQIAVLCILVRSLFIVHVQTPCATLARGRGGRRGGRVSSGILQWILWWMAMLAPGLTASPTLIDDRRGSSRAVAR